MRDQNGYTYTNCNLYPTFRPCSKNFSMLAARASTPRNVQRIARTFDTAVDSAGLRVAAIDNNQPTSAVTFLVKAGSPNRELHIP